MKFRSILFIASLTLICQTGFSQVYTFLKTENAYQQLEGAVSINNGEVWTYPAYEINLGFNFYLFDTLINKVYFFEEAQGSVLSSTMSTDRYHKMIMPFGAGMVDRGYPTTQSLSPLSYKVTGEPGYRICQIEWRNAGFLGDFEENGFFTDYVNFQLWLYESTGLIEMHYGPSLITDFDINFGASGPSVGLIPWYDNDEYLFSSESLWLEGNPESPAVYQSDEFIFLNGMIQPNTTYQFTNNLTIGTNHLTFGDLTVYPNPVSESLSIQLHGQHVNKVLVQIIDLSGRTVIDAVYTLTNQQINIPSQDLSPGIYNIKLQTNKTISTGKFVKLL